MKKIILSSMIGNGLEWYEYALYAYVVTIISKLFFPAGDESAHLLATLGIFAVGFVARPFGGILFGIIGDRYGRRAALVASIFLMAIPTGLIGLLPTFAQVGIAAPLLLTFLRIMQGLSLGGEFSGSMTFLVEHAPSNKRGLIGALSLASLILGFLLGSLVATLINALVGEAAFAAWGWRIPFLLGVPIGLVGYYIRHHCAESPTYVFAKEQGTLSETPIRDAITQEYWHILQSIGIFISVTMPFYLVSAFFMTFTEHTLGRSREEALMLNTLNMLILLVGSLFSAWLADRIGRKRILVVTAVAYLILTYPTMQLMLRPELSWIVLGQAFFAIVVSIYIGPIPAILVEMFPTRVRYSGMALSYNICAALFGGTAPMVNQWLITTTGNKLAMAWYVVACAAISLFSLYFYRDQYQESLR
jgi:MFS transporter, MHS family, proline/betaine transporter